MRISDHRSRKFCCWSDTRRTFRLWNGFSRGCLQNREEKCRLLRTASNLRLYLSLVIWDFKSHYHQLLVTWLSPIFVLSVSCIQRPEILAAILCLLESKTELDIGGVCLQQPKSKAWLSSSLTLNHLFLCVSKTPPLWQGSGGISLLPKSPQRFTNCFCPSLTLPEESDW